jgi:TRAP-type C4-dicarboxylate transport system permease small subunit
MKLFNKFQDIVNNLIAGVMMIIMCIILAQTLGRVFHLSIPWSEEASRYLFVTMILLGINIGISRNMMVSIDIVDNFLSKSVRRIFDIVREVIGLVVACLFFYSTFAMIKVGQFQKSPAMQIPMSVMYVVMAVGFGLAVLAVVMRLVKLFMKSEEGKES